MVAQKSRNRNPIKPQLNIQTFLEGTDQFFLISHLTLLCPIFCQNIWSKTNHSSNVGFSERSNVSYWMAMYGLTSSKTFKSSFGACMMLEARESKTKHSSNMLNTRLNIIEHLVCPISRAKCLIKNKTRLSSDMEF